MITMTDAEVLELLQDFLNMSKSHIEALAEVSAGWQARAEAAEAENARLRQELAEMAALWQCAIDADLQDDPCEMEAAIIRAAAMLNYPPPVDDD